MASPRKKRYAFRCVVCNEFFPAARPALTCSGKCRKAKHDANDPVDFVTVALRNQHRNAFAEVDGLLPADAYDRDPNGTLTLAAQTALDAACAPGRAKKVIRSFSCYQKRLSFD